MACRQLGIGMVHFLETVCIARNRALRTDLSLVKTRCSVEPAFWEKRCYGVRETSQAISRVVIPTPDDEPIAQMASRTRVNVI